MKGAVLYGPRDIRFVEREEPKIVHPTDVIINLSATCVCGSDLWPYRGVDASSQPTPMGHEYCGIVEEVGSAVRKVRRGQFVVGSFFASDNSCAICNAGYQSRCVHRRICRRGRCTGTPAARSACGWHAGCHAGSPVQRLDPEPPRYLRCARDWLVCRGRGGRPARANRRRRR